MFNTGRLQNLCSQPCSCVQCQGYGVSCFCYFRRFLGDGGLSYGLFRKIHNLLVKMNYWFLLNVCCFLSEESLFLCYGSSLVFQLLALLCLISIDWGFLDAKRITVMEEREDTLFCGLQSWNKLLYWACDETSEVLLFQRQAEVLSLLPLWGVEHLR